MIGTRASDQLRAAIGRCEAKVLGRRGWRTCRRWATDIAPDGTTELCRWHLHRRPASATPAAPAAAPPRVDPADEWHLPDCTLRGKLMGYCLDCSAGRANAALASKSEAPRLDPYTLEEAAKVCDEEERRGGERLDVAGAGYAERCATRIRALAERGPR